MSIRIYVKINKFHLEKHLLDTTALYLWNVPRITNFERGARNFPHSLPNSNFSHRQVFPRQNSIKTPFLGPQWCWKCGAGAKTKRPRYSIKIIRLRDSFKKYFPNFGAFNNVNWRRSVEAKTRRREWGKSRKGRKKFETISQLLFLA